MKKISYSSFNNEKNELKKIRIKILSEYLAGMATSLFAIGVSSRVPDIPATALLVSGATMGVVFTFEMLKKVSLFAIDKLPDNLSNENKKIKYDDLNL